MNLASTTLSTHKTLAGIQALLTYYAVVIPSLLLVLVFLLVKIKVRIVDTRAVVGSVIRSQLELKNLIIYKRRVRASRRDPVESEYLVPTYSACVVDLQEDCDNPESDRGPDSC